MKKIMMAVAIVCAACSIQAAQVAWAAYQFQGGEIYDYGYCSDLAAGDAIVLCLMDGDTVAQVLDTAVEDGGAYGGVYTFSYSESIIQNGDVLKVLVKDAGGSYFDLTAAANDQGCDPTVINTLTVSGLADDTWMNDEFIYATGNFSAAGGVIPEPTSGLLLLIGMAGLALKRKVA